jgi:hypothetical protein
LLDSERDWDRDSERAGEDDDGGVGRDSTRDGLGGDTNTGAGDGRGV